MRRTTPSNATFLPAAGEQDGERRSGRTGPDDDDTSDRHDATPYTSRASGGRDTVREGQGREM